MHVSESRKEVLQIKELRMKCMKHWPLTDKAAWMFVTKDCYKTFKKSVKGHFQEFLVKYCDTKVQTNPRWAYHAYLVAGKDVKYLTHYSIEAMKDFPLKEATITVATSMVINITLLSTFLTLLCFLLMHAVTLGFLEFGYCTNVKGLFTGMAGVLILLSIWCPGEGVA